MSLADVEQIALKLSENDRALLAAALLDSVAPDRLDQTAEEFDRREYEMDQGQAPEISYDELVKRVNAERKG